jgi:hypothetical protein
MNPHIKIARLTQQIAKLTAELQALRLEAAREDAEWEAAAQAEVSEARAALASKKPHAAAAKRFLARMGEE